MNFCKKISNRDNNPPRKNIPLMETVKNEGNQVVLILCFFSIHYISYSDEKAKPLSKKYFDMMSSTVFLQLNFYLQNFIFYNAKINHSNLL